MYLSISEVWIGRRKYNTAREGTDFVNYQMSWPQEGVCVCVCGPVTGECLTVIRGPVCDVAPCKRVVQADVLSSNANVRSDSGGCLILKKSGVKWSVWPEDKCRVSMCEWLAYLDSVEQPACILCFLLCHVSTFSTWQAWQVVRACHIFMACHVAIPTLSPQWRDLVTEGVSANLSFLKDVWLWYCVPLVQMLMRECVHSTSWCSISVQKNKQHKLYRWTCYTSSQFSLLSSVTCYFLNLGLNFFPNHYEKESHSLSGNT